MIAPATGMKPGTCYAIESVERAPQFPGFFLDGKYYLGPELQTAVGWLEGQDFIYDQLDPTGEPIYPDRRVGQIQNLALTLGDGQRLALNEIPYPTTAEPEAAAPHSRDDLPPNQQRKTRLSGKLVVITGASSGIGRAAAQAFADEQARLVLAARDEVALAEVVDECVARGAAALAVRTDVTDSAQMQALASQAAEFGDGRIDIWINNAGVGAVGSFEQTPLDVHEQVLQTDLLGYLRGAYVVWPYFKAQKQGVLINTLSLGSWVAQPYAAAYSASKYGLRGLTEALRGELSGCPDIHVCDIYPAVIDTPGFRDGANFTGHALKPPPPVYDPHRVARAMVHCALHPKPSTTVGAAATLARAAHFVLPGFPQLSGWLTRWGFNRSPATATSSGNLFNPPGGERRVEGGWRSAKAQASPLWVAGAALLVGGCLLALTRSRTR
ncbi:SDR family oxidoreductase [Pseudomonas hamedanensis]|uniref:SDR family oxidoreductase n=1 Tax=Pseudomonas hamedanensis TaxID=2745504 RepID=A0A9E6TI94_9PSED|nr:SDR family oxidoreductase [Pseudomonas hamedanensis]QXI18649.1 SDR family oxidoreductase [Pseudomonas hamedanensis]